MRCTCWPVSRRPGGGTSMRSGETSALGSVAVPGVCWPAAGGASGAKRASTAAAGAARRSGEGGLGVGGVRGRVRPGGGGGGGGEGGEHRGCEGGAAHRLSVLGAASEPAEVGADHRREVGDRPRAAVPPPVGDRRGRI